MVKMTRAGTAEAVEIFGSIYHVRGDKESEYLQDLAGMVDHKMREISNNVATVDAGKIAILAALNIADELNQCRKQQEREREEIQEKVVTLVNRLEEVLET